jgi:hypothetical protein
MLHLQRWRLLQPVSGHAGSPLPWRCSVLPLWHWWAWPHGGWQRLDSCPASGAWMTGSLQLHRATPICNPACRPGRMMASHAARTISRRAQGRAPHRPSPRPQPCRAARRRQDRPRRMRPPPPQSPTDRPLRPLRCPRCPRCRSFRTCRGRHPPHARCSCPRRRRWQLHSLRGSVWPLGIELDRCGGTRPDPSARPEASA